MFSVQRKSLREQDGIQACWKKDVSQKEEELFSLCDRADKARISGLDCRKGIHTGYNNKTPIRNSEI